MPNAPHLFDAEATRQALEWPALVDALRAAFTQSITQPLRHQHTVPIPNQASGTLLLMPAWIEGEVMGVKQAFVAPDNGSQGLPVVMTSYSLSSAVTGQPLAIIDGDVLTLRRTAAASALASEYLSRPNATRLTIIGTGQLAHQLALAHSAVRPIDAISVWGRDATKAQTLSHALNQAGLNAIAETNIEQACAQADIISCATATIEPLINADMVSA